MHTLYKAVAGAICVALFSIAWAEEPEAVLPEAVPGGAETASGTGSSAPDAPVPLSGTVEATFDHDEAAGTWAVHASGSYAGLNASVTSLFVYGAGDDGSLLGRESIGGGNGLPVGSPFTLDLPLSKPNPDWAEIGFGITLSDANGSTTDAVSGLFPIFWQHPVLIDHARSGSVVPAPNYDPGIIPSGIGIPHAPINGVPEGDYYAVVFFSDLNGCPSDNYSINSFAANAYWGYDVRGPNAPFSKAFSSAGGGCMQEFHIDPRKDEDWLWGALSNSGTSSAIADEKGVPAFAICATRAACDPIIPSMREAETPVLPPATTTDAISNVLFLPGIKGSKLYKDNPLCLIPGDSCGIPLWLPLADSAVPELFMDAEGKSKKGIYVKEDGILGSALGKSFYDSFTQMLDEVKADGTFGSGWSWKALAYDWRLSLPDLVRGGAEHGSDIYYGEETDAPYLKESLLALASSSPTHKVTIIAHSNGGMVAKALMEELGDTLAAQLIDSVVFVGVPQSGAPRSLGALLYGDKEGMPGLKNIPDFIMSAAHAREFALNDPMAYHLLPSARYFDSRIPSYPLVRFEDGDALAKERAAYGTTIDSAAELRAFALAQESGRAMPAPDDLNSANILNPGLLAYAQQEHAALDSWQQPQGVRVYQLGGYGAETLSGIDLYQAPQRDGSSLLAYRPLFTEDGDGTVPVISSLMMNVSADIHQVWLDLPSMRSNGLAYTHANLLESPDVEKALRAILQHLPVPDAVHASEAAPPPAAHKLFGFFVHSPVSLAVSDGRGNATSVADDSEEDIPGSTSGMFGDVKYVVVPADAGVAYTLRLTGESAGTFTLDLLEMLNGDILASSTIADVPVENGTHATLGLRDSLADASPLEIDEDGDGAPDASIAPRLGATVFPPDTVKGGGPPEAATPNASPSRKSAILRAIAKPVAYVRELVTAPAAQPIRETTREGAKTHAGKDVRTHPPLGPDVHCSAGAAASQETAAPPPESLRERILSFARYVLRAIARLARILLIGR